MNQKKSFACGRIVLKYAGIQFMRKCEKYRKL